MNEAIKLAIEKGGYSRAGFASDVLERFAINNFPFVILDPLFWQALGKALGWERIIGFDEIYSPAQDEAFEWYHNAMQYYHLVLTGGETEKFWRELINK